MNNKKIIKLEALIERPIINNWSNNITAIADHAIELPPAIGTGVSYALTLDQQTQLMLTDVNFFQKTTFESGKESLCGVFIVLEGRLKLLIDNKKEINISKDNMAIFFVGNSQCQCTYSAQKTKIINFSIDEELMVSLLQQCNDAPEKQKINGRWQFDNCLWAMPIIPEISHVIRQIYVSELEKSANKIYLKAKVMEILTLAFNWYHQKKSQLNGLSRKDFDCITHAAKLIEKQMKNPPSLLELAHMVGINDNKLKKQFKMVFNKPVFEYLNTQRMLKAKELFINTEYNVKYIAEEVGFKHIGYFSGQFKKTYELSPSQFIKKYRSISSADSILKCITFRRL